MITKPADVICDDWEPKAPGSKACRYYIKPSDPLPPDSTAKEEDRPRGAGLCQLPSRFLCVEWVRRSGTDTQLVTLGLTRHVPASLPTSGESPPPPIPKPPTATASEPLAPGRPLQVPQQPSPSPLDVSLEALAARAVASLEATARTTNFEVVLAVPYEPREITLVADRTGRTDRTEVTFREAAMLRMLVDAFPGAQVEYRLPSGIRLLDSLERPFDDYPLTGGRCSVCGTPQRTTPGGATCIQGHGGAEAAQ